MDTVLQLVRDVQYLVYPINIAQFVILFFYLMHMPYE